MFAGVHALAYALGLATATDAVSAGNAESVGKLVCVSRHE